MLIYSMPRARSHVALEAAKRSIKLVEPIGFRPMFKHHIRERYDLPAYFDGLITDEQWSSTRDAMDGADTATKLFGYHLFEVKRAGDWWQSAQDNDHHDIYVLERDRFELCMSLLLGLVIGFQLANERPAIPLSIDGRDLWIVYRYVEEHVRYLPSRGKLISWDDLPDDEFDKSKVIMQGQRSMSRLDLIQNRHWCEQRVREILDRFKDEWDQKIARLTDGTDHR